MSWGRAGRAAGVGYSIIIIIVIIVVLRTPSIETRYKDKLHRHDRVVILDARVFVVRHRAALFHGTLSFAPFD